MAEITEIYENMKETYREITGADINDMSDMAVRMYAAAVEIASLYTYNDFVKRQAFPQTATGDYLENHAQVRGLSRLKGAFAVGEITFSCGSAAQNEIDVPSGVVCYTDNGTRFITTAAGKIAAGENSCTVPCRCESAGQAGNVSAGTVIYMAVKPTYIVGCRNDDPFSGGIDEESDESLRERLIAAYNALPNGTNAAYYEKEVLQIEGVAAAAVLPKNRGLGTVDIVVASETGVPDDALLAAVKDVLDEKREMCVDIGVLAPETVMVNVTAEIAPAAGYSFAQAKAEAEASLAAMFDGRLLEKGILVIDIQNRIYNLPSVGNFKITLPVNDIEAKKRYLPVMGTISVTEME